MDNLTIAIATTLITAAIGVTGTVVVKSYRKLRAWIRKQLPSLLLYDNHSQILFDLATDYTSELLHDRYNASRKVTRIVVRKPRGEKCLMQHYIPRKVSDTITQYGSSEWRDFCDYSEEPTLVGIISIRVHFPSVLLAFLCVPPSRRWWKPWNRKQWLLYDYQRGNTPAFDEYPGMKEIVSSR